MGQDLPKDLRGENGVDAAGSGRRDDLWHAAGDWRLILQKDTSAAYGLAVDETTAVSVARRISPPILHLYNFLPCVVLGRYQSAEEAIDVEACQRLGLEINRRHTGGGTVLMGPRQLALGFSISRSYPGIGPSINDIFKSLGGVLCNALGRLGLKARFRPKNDIEMKGKKIAGLSASLEERDVAFFHASLLLDFDFKLMMKVFRLPIKKLEDKRISCFTERMTTVRAERGRKIDLPSFQSIVRKAFEEYFEITFRIDTLNQWELDHLDTLLRQRYTNPEWIFSRRHPGVATGFASAKTPGGLVEVGVTLAGEVIEAAYLFGDFLSTGTQVNRVESALRYCAACADAIRARLGEVMTADAIFKVSCETLARLVLEAARQARVAREKALKEQKEVREAQEEERRREVEAMRAALIKKPPPPEETRDEKGVLMNVSREGLSPSFAPEAGKAPGAKKAPGRPGAEPAAGALIRRRPLAAPKKKAKATKSSRSPVGDRRARREPVKRVKGKKSVGKSAKGRGVRQEKKKKVSLRARASRRASPARKEKRR